MTRTPAIRVRGLTVKYDDTVALTDVDIEVGAAKVCGLVGVNGSGKSTLFKALMSSVRFSEGSVQVDGVSSVVARRSGIIGYVPQSEQIDWAFPLNVGDVVLMGRYGKMGSRRTPNASHEEAVSLALAQVGMESVAKRQIGALSGGQRKRVFVARSLAQGAKVMLLDEPFAGVDAVSQAAIISVLRGLVERGGSALIATHDLSVLPDLCDEVVMLRNRVVFRGATNDALRPENLALAFGLDLTETRGGAG